MESFSFTSRNSRQIFISLFNSVLANVYFVTLMHQQLINLLQIYDVWIKFLGFVELETTIYGHGKRNATNYSFKFFLSTFVDMLA